MIMFWYFTCLQHADSYKLFDPSIFPWLCCQIWRNSIDPWKKHILSIYWIMCVGSFCTGKIFLAPKLIFGEKLPLEKILQVTSWSIWRGILGGELLCAQLLAIMSCYFLVVYTEFSVLQYKKIGLEKKTSQIICQQHYHKNSKGFHEHDLKHRWRQCENMAGRWLFLGREWVS